MAVHLSLKKCVRCSIDPRANLLALLLSASSIFVLQGQTATFWLFGISLFQSMMNQLWRHTAIYTVIFIALKGVQSVASIFYASIIESFLLRGLCVALAVLCLTKRNEPAAVIASLRKMKIPDAVIVPLSIMIRFFPVLRKQFVFVSCGLKTRGIRLMGKSPVAVYELFMVPVMKQLLKTGDQLSAAAETRGISASGAKSSYILCRLKTADYILMAVAIAVYGYAFMQFKIGGFV